MPILPLALGLLVSLSAALLMVPLVRRLALRFGWVDAPDGDRKRHAGATPNVGGIAIVGAAGVGVAVVAVVALGLPGHLTASLALPSPLVLLGALAIAGVGFVDDLREVSHRAKFAAQLAVTALAFLGGARIQVFDAALGDGALALAVSAVLTTVWMVGLMNAVNLIDGMDGLAAGVVAIAFAALACAHGIGGDVGSLLLAASIGGALLGFLRYNFAPATIFMGDSGSLFLGYTLASYALRGTSHANPVLALVIPAVIMGIPVLDTIVSMVRRKVTGKPLFYPDRDHIHHRLQAQMPTHQAALVLYGFGVFLALGALWMAAVTPAVAVVVFGVGTAAVYAFLCYVQYLPTPEQARRFVERRRRIREVLAGRPERAPGRAGRISDERFYPAAGPER